MTVVDLFAGMGGWDIAARQLGGDSRCFQPGGHHEPGEQSENATKLTLPEGLVLQGFPPDWPVQGTQTARWLQVGNAVCPPLAAAILAQLIGHTP